MNMEDLQETFQTFDKTGGNVIDAPDMENFLFACGLNPLKSDINKILEELGPKPITFEQAAAYYTNISSKTEPVMKETLNEIFKPFDREGNGQILLAEFRQIASSLGDKLTEDEINQVLSFIEVSNNGAIIYEDLVKWALNG